ncbi:effector-associated constant component EACC1 [Micromonospora tarensis]|uniref:Peptidase A2 domain-containing protein n=1 Tax=Micromonospora tarensis TaxID=2806100 RepID=A0ABS1YPZ1_9ACTN|nr:hypothetical protein [Micromonospora tarensis]MBM0279518.1 hypothetical protein [Micromonospora tarensis]
MPASGETITLVVQPDLPSANAGRSLASWLRSEDRLREKVSTTPVADAAVPSGDLAAEATHSLRVLVDSGADVMVLVQAVAGWLTHRRDDLAVTLTGPDGWSAELDVRRARDMGQVTALVGAAVGAVAPQQA